MPRVSISPLVSAAVWVATAAAGAGAGPVPGAPADLGPMLEQVRVQNELPALALVVARHGAVVAQGQVGVRRVGHPDPVTPQDRFHFGSCGKAATATVVARLVDRGDLRWETTLAEVFPELGEDLDPGYRPVTLAQLLGHRGGAPGNLFEFLGLETWKSFFEGTRPPVEARARLAKLVLTRPPPTPPGQDATYSNAGITLAGIAAERAAGVPFERLVVRELAAPLGMASLGFGAPGVVGDHPWGHYVDPASGEVTAVPPGPGADNPPAIRPAGTAHATPRDWAKFLSAHATPDLAGLLRPETVRRLHTSQGPFLAPDKGYAMGWVTGTFFGREGALLHDGSNRTFLAMSFVHPASGLAAVVVTNVAGPGVDQACATALARALRGR